jgi:hypothetical protein
LSKADKKAVVEGLHKGCHLNKRGMITTLGEELAIAGLVRVRFRWQRLERLEKFFGGDAGKGTQSIEVFFLGRNAGYNLSIIYIY